MRWRGWIGVLLLAPLALVAVGTQLALLLGLAGAVQGALGARARDSAQLDRGIDALQSATAVLAWTWSSPAARALELNPVTLGAVDDLAATADALDAGAAALTPLGTIGEEVLGFDGAAPMIAGTTIDTARLPDLAEPVAQVHRDLRATWAALAAVPGSGPLGRPIGAIAASIEPTVADLAELSAAAEIAWPDLPQALGADGARRYLVCALNDAESFGSGGAPLSAFMVEAVRGSLSVPVSGQLESKLSPDNPPIRWRHAGGPPWYREGKEYPFVNSNFHPDFRTAAEDMRRAWAALGYPEVEGVVTIDVSALASILEWTGGIDTPGYGRITHENLVRTILVDAYREFDSEQGVLERHARNDALVSSMLEHLTSPLALIPAMRGTMDAIPPRHVQASFRDATLQAAVDEIGATGALAEAPGDLIGAYSQSGPNKLTVFQERTIVQRVALQADGGATVRRTITFANDVPDDLEGDPTTYRGYTALLARIRVAHRIPLTATDLRISTGTAIGLVKPAQVGPYPDDRGGQVLWQGQDIPPGTATTVEITYRLPAGTFAPGSYEVRADPQALPRTVALSVHVAAPGGEDLPDTDGWTRNPEGELVWTGQLDRPLTLRVG